MTNMIAAGDSILKTDTKGRGRTSLERRESLLDELNASGLSGAKRAELAGIKVSDLCGVGTRRRKQRGQATVPAICVSGRSKPARDGQMKTGHFESGIAPEAAIAALMGDEPTPCEPATFYHYAGGQRLVGSQDRPGTGHPPRDGGPLFAGGQRFKTSHSAHRLGCAVGFKTGHCALRVKSGRTSQCAPLSEVVEQGLLAGLSAQRIYQDLVTGHAFSGGYDAVKRFVRQLTHRVELPFRRMECAPGHELQVDFGQKRVGPRLFTLAAESIHCGSSNTQPRPDVLATARRTHHAFGDVLGMPLSSPPFPSRSAVEPGSSACPFPGRFVTGV